MDVKHEHVLRIAAHALKIGRVDAKLADSLLGIIKSIEAHGVCSECKAIGAAYKVGKDAPVAQANADRVDALRWRTFEKTLHSRLPGAAHGTKIKVVEVCPMYGEEREIENITKVIDAAMSSPTDGKWGANGAG